MLKADRKAEIEILSAVKPAPDARSPPPSQPPHHALETQPDLQTLPGNQGDAVMGARPPSQLMRYLFDKIGASLAAQAVGE